MRPLLLTLLLPLFAVGDDLKSKLDPLAKKLTDKGEHVGFVVGVLKDGKQQFFSYGTVETAKGKAAPDENTLFEIGSITKTFTGILLAEGVLRNELTLDQPAQKYLPPELALPVKDDLQITLTHLATHRSGFPSVPIAIGVLPPNVKNPYAHYTLSMLAKDLREIKPNPPGERYRYSNMGAGLAGIACVHTAKARSFDRLIRERITEPLKMFDTAEALTGEQLSRFAKGHDDKGKITSSWEFACLQACGGLRSTAKDLLKYAAANLSNSKDAPYALMRESHKPLAKITGNVRIGLFWIVDKDGVIWHNGGTGGFTAMLIIDPKTGTALVVLCAATEKEFVEVTRDMFDTVRGK